MTQERFFGIIYKTRLCATMNEIGGCVMIKNNAKLFIAAFVLSVAGTVLLYVATNRLIESINTDDDDSDRNMSLDEKEYNLA